MKLIIEDATRPDGVASIPSTPDRVAHAVSLLDGRSCTLVCIEDDEAGRVLMIGGGPERFIVTEGDVASQEFEIAHTKPRSDARDVELMAGAQIGRYPEWQLVSREQAARIGIFYIALGRRDPSVRWSVA